jgi:signal transduction histidine kinase/uncharacterized protein YdeI (BOF family)
MAAFSKRWKTIARLGVVLLAACPPAGAGAPTPRAATNEVTSFLQLYNLSKAQASAGLVFRTKAVVLCSDPGWGQLYFHDGEQAKWISPLTFSNQFRFKNQVELRGNVQLQGEVAALTNLQAEVLGEQSPPEAAPLRLADFARGFGEWVETTGKVRVADTSRGRLALIIENETHTCLAYVMGPLTTNNSKEFVGGTVRLRGVNSSKIENSKLIKASLFVPELSEVQLLARPKSDFAALPVSAIEKLLNLELGPWTNEMVHLNGTIASYKPGASLELKDPTGTIKAEVVQMTRTLPDQRANLWGYPAVTEEGLIIKDAYFEPVTGAQPLVLSQALPATISSNSILVFSNVVEVTRLRNEQAAGHIPVRLKGVILYADPEWHNFFFHDETGELFVECDQANIEAGQWVELRGRTAPGGFTPEIQASSITILGVTNLPAPAKVDLTDLADGHLDGHWVELEGVVRRVTHEWDHLDLSVTTSKGRFRAIVPKLAVAEEMSELVDCFVRVRGACGAQLNTRGQLSGITLHVPSLTQIQVIDGVTANPFATRTTPIAALAHFDPERRAGRRVKLSGTVLLPLRQGGFYLHDGSGGVRVQTQQPAKVQPGERIELLGFAALGEFAPYLDEAIYRHLSNGKLPAAKKISAEDILVKGVGDAEIVEMEAQLLQDVPRSARPKLLLQDGNVLFTASLEHSDPDKSLEWKAGSLLRLRGICSIQADEMREPQGFKLLIAGSENISVLKAPLWWSIRRTLMLLAGLTATILAAIGWIALLRRQVRLQTDVLHENQKELLQTSRQAGMAEVATSVLHNVGNVLNSINVSTTLLDERARKSRVCDLKRLVTLLDEHADDLANFLNKDERSDQVRDFLRHLSERLDEEQTLALSELADLRKNVSHVKDIISMQQSYAKVSGVVETVELTELVEDTLRMNSDSLNRRNIKVVREYDAVPAISTDKHKLLQILVNLVRNANAACDQVEAPDRQVTVRVSNGDAFVRIAVADNGVGIRPEYLTRIFNHGFTTRKDGHGFGLHSGALAAKELGGTLTVRSDGPGKGATFILALPVSRSRPDG